MPLQLPFAGKVQVTLWTIAQCRVTLRKNSRLTLLDNHRFLDGMEGRRQRDWALSVDRDLLRGDVVAVTVQLHLVEFNLREEIVPKVVVHVSSVQ